jgi:8-oxo-dGTP pyrophosphatase MutT (NUDIX family)
MKKSLRNKGFFLTPFYGWNWYTLIMFRKGVSALIVNKKQEFLLVNLQSFKTHFFAIPGGGLDDDESLEEAVYREVEEEVGIHKESLEFIGASKQPVQFKFKLNREGKEYEGSERYFFGFRFIGNDDEIKLQESEVRAYKWVAFNDLKGYLLFDNQLEETSEKINELFSF